jgi:hypothetical protein
LISLGFSMATIDQQNQYGASDRELMPAPKAADAAIHPSTVAILEAQPQFAELITEYAAESAIAGMPPPSARMDDPHPTLGAWGRGSKCRRQSGFLPHRPRDA